MDNLFNWMNEVKDKINPLIISSIFHYMLKVIDEAVDDMVINQQETTQEKILKLIKKNPSVTQNEMAKIFDLTRDGIAYNIKILKGKGIIKRTGSTKNGTWEIANEK